MIIELVVGAIIGGAVVYIGTESSSGVVASVKAEIAKIEAEVTSGKLLATAKADALAVIARLKALL
jgi:hypothetical protein